MRLGPVLDHAADDVSDRNPHISHRPPAANPRHGASGCRPEVPAPAVCPAQSGCARPAETRRPHVLMNSTLLQILSLTLFEKIPLQQAFPGSDYISEQGNDSNQLNLFEF
jgi:hypothetical protein